MRCLPFLHFSLDLPFDHHTNNPWNVSPTLSGAVPADPKSLASFAAEFDYRDPLRLESQLTPEELEIKYTVH